MRGIGALLVVLAVFVAGCPKKAEVADAAPEAAAVVVDAAPAGPEAVNAEQVGRFADEAAIDHQAATLEAAKTNVRKTPPSGEVIATLAKGATVTQIASHDKYILVTFDDPKNGSQRLMGWVVKDAFGGPPAVRPKGACPAGETILVADTTFCGKVCKTDAECGGGHACTGTAQMALSDGGAGATVHNCVGIARPDAGVATVDAGPAPVAVDAGPPKPVVVDAGGGGGGGGGPIVVDPKDNACAAGYKLVDFDKKCHRTCQKNEDCGGAGVICTRGKYCKSGP